MIYFVPRYHKLLNSNKESTGIITSHRSSELQGISSGIVWCCDNCVFTDKFDEKKFFNFLERRAKFSQSCKFVVCPDVVGDCDETLRRWQIYRDRIAQLGYPVAFAVQDGQSIDRIPEECDAIFIGGTTEFKMSEKVIQIIKHFKKLGKWVHVGRVNSFKRYSYFKVFGVDSVDGTHPVFAPDEGVRDVIEWALRPNQMSMFS